MLQRVIDIFTAYPSLALFILAAFGMMFGEGGGLDGGGDGGGD
jgi:hypothetical protein